MRFTFHPKIGQPYVVQFFVRDAYGNVLAGLDPTMFGLSMSTIGGTFNALTKNVGEASPGSPNVRGLYCFTLDESETMVPATILVNPPNGCTLELFIDPRD